MLSVVITTWNESQNLPRVVASVTDLADEIVVVDTESTDNTVALAKKLGCKVFSYPHPGIVEVARNFSITKATGDWILLLDADEEVPEEVARYIKKVISQNKVDYCRLARKNIIFNKWITSSHWWPDYVYRLFKKGAVSWQESIHSIPITEGVGFDFPDQENLAIVHHNYQTVSQYLDRLNRYTDFQAKELFSAGTRFTWPDVIKKPTQEFFSQYFSRKGYKDQLHGLVLSLLQAFSQLVVYLKLWQLSDFTQIKVSPKDLIRASKSSRQDWWWWYRTSRVDSSSGLMKIWWKICKRLSL
jgi:glycosyltransferase involved in cell wall biosynthesis